MSKELQGLLAIVAALLLGAVAGVAEIPWLISTANVTKILFIKFLSLISLPIVFFAIISSLVSMQTLQSVRLMGTRVVRYTLLTTFLAALIAFMLYVIIDPTRGVQLTQVENLQASHNGYFNTLFDMIPSNLFVAFYDTNVLGVALIAFILGFATLTLPDENRQSLELLYSSLFQTFLKLAQVLIVLMPLGIWAFATLFTVEILNGSTNFSLIIRYMLTVLIANLIQAWVIIPLLLTWKGISPRATLRAVYPALLMAFFSKSSSASLPLSIDCLQKHGTSPKVTQFSMPLCSIINMNGCAGFIFITVIFASSLHGIHFSWLEMGAWVFVATLAAVGNASVPMGCYFLSSAFLLGMGIPLDTMGVILTVYAFLDMVETALNVWSDCAITSVVDAELSSLS